MKARLVKVGLFAAIAALAFCLVGCSSSQNEYVEINGKKMGLEELPKLIEENQLVIKDEYIGKDITVVAPFISIEGEATSTLDGSSETQIMLERPLGEVVIGTKEGRYVIQITEENKSIASTLRKGDLVKANGVFSAYNDTSKTIYLLTFDGFDSPNSVQPYIEIIKK